MGQSPLLRKAQLLETGLSLVWSLMGQSLLWHNAHLLEMGLSLIWSLMGQSHMLLNARQQFGVNYTVYCKLVYYKPPHHIHTHTYYSIL